MTGFSIFRPSWWQWPTVLSLDAPAVSTVWLALLARSLHVELHWPAFFVLGSSVWLAYAADRWIEGWRLPGGSVRTQRHQFYQRWRWPVLTVWIVVLAASVGVAAATLARAKILTGLVLTSSVVMYVVSHQFVHRTHRWRVPKEICVAGLLMGGSALFLIDQARIGAVVASLALFGSACFANCALISVWERDVDLAHGQSSLASHTGRARLIRWLPWSVIGLGLACLVAGDDATRAAAACAASSGVLLAAIDQTASRSGWSAAHVLADLALMTPLIPLLCHR